MTNYKIIPKHLCFELYTENEKGVDHVTELMKTCKELGNPFFFQYHHGLTVRAYSDAVEQGDYDNIEFRLKGQMVLDLSPSYVKLTSVRRPGDLVTTLRKCFEVRQVESGETLGWLCWR